VAQKVGSADSWLQTLPKVLGGQHYLYADTLEGGQEQADQWQTTLVEVK
jgi:hypothetical protein